MLLQVWSTVDVLKIKVQKSITYISMSVSIVSTSAHMKVISKPIYLVVTLSVILRIKTPKIVQVSYAEKVALEYINYLYFIVY